MYIADHKSLGMADMIRGRVKRKRAKEEPGLWGRKCASAKDIERSLKRVKG